MLRRVPAMACLTLLLALGVLSADVGTARAGGGFTTEERARLSQGGLVTRPESRRQGDLQLVGGTAWQVIDATPDAVFRALLDTPHYDRLLPQVAEARTVLDADGRRLVFVRHAQGLVEASYYLSVSYQPDQKTVQFRLDPSRDHSIREAWGFFMVQPYGTGQALVTYGIMADFGDGIFSALIRPSVHEWILRVPETIKRHVEGSGRQRYAGPSPGSPRMRM